MSLQGWSFGFGRTVCRFSECLRLPHVHFGFHQAFPLRKTVPSVDRGTCSIRKMSSDSLSPRSPLKIGRRTLTLHPSAIVSELGWTLYYPHFKIQDLQTKCIGHCVVSEPQVRGHLWHYQLAGISLDLSSLPREVFEKAENKKSTDSLYF